jgi:Spy/CpxP family protein refolding chaperone
MKNVSQWALALALAVVAVAVPAAQAQRGQGGFGFGGGPLFLLSQESVQDELKMAEEQIKKVSQLSEKRREAVSQLRNLDPEERQKKLRKWPRPIIPRGLPKS